METKALKKDPGGNDTGPREAASAPVLRPPRNRNHKWLPRALALLLVAAVLAGAAWWWVDGRLPTVQTVLTKRGTAAAVVYATGAVEPVYWAKVVSLNRKRIVDICRCEGQAVKKGDVLVRLDDTEEQAVLRELTARRDRLQEDVDRLKSLLDRRIISQTTYDDKLTQLREYEARVAAQNDRIADLKLRAPMDGVVLRRDGEVGEIAATAASDVLFWVGKPEPLRVVAEVNEEDILSIREGQAVLLRHEGHDGGPLEATVDRITPKGDPESKTFRVYLGLPKDTPLKTGMSVEANIVVREAKDVLLVPAEALNGEAVYVIADGRLRRQPVEPGVRGTRMVEIKSGLSEGQRLVSPAPRDLSEGARVKASDPGGTT